MHERNTTCCPSPARIGRTLGVAAILAASLLPVQSRAITGSVTVHWNTLVIEVINADPLDGITPALAWLDQRTASGTFRDGVGLLSDQRFAPDWTTAQSAQYSDATLTVHTSFDADALRIDAASTGGSWSASAVERYGRFQVDGAAEVRASVFMQASVSATPGELLWRGGPYGVVWPYADANLFFGDAFRTGFGPVAYLRADLGSWGATNSGTLTASIVLGAGDSAYLWMQPGVVLNPVPEPSAWLAMLAGLALLGTIGWRARLRRAVQARPGRGSPALRS